MKNFSVRLALICAIFAAFFPSENFASDARAVSVAGFDFALSAEAAARKAAEMGLEGLEDGRSKNGRKTLVFKGSAAGIFSGADKRVRTRLTFFGGSIEAATLLVSSASEGDFLLAEKFVSEKYGDPAADEEVFSFRVKSWELPDEKVVLSHAPGGVLKLDHIHLPTRNSRYERDLKRAKIKDKRSPAQRIIDGDFSKPDYR